MAIQLESVEISNFKSIVNCVLPLSSYTPLIGYNNSGKSNSIAAMQWLLRRSLLVKSDFHNVALPIEVAGTITGITAAHVAAMPPVQQRQIAPYIVAETLKVKRAQAPAATKASEITLSVWEPTASTWNTNPTGIDNALSALLPEPIRIGAMEDAAEDASKAKASTTIGKLLSEFVAPVRAAHHAELSGFLNEISRRICADGNQRFAELVTIEDQITVKINDLFPGIGARLHFPVPELEDLVKAGTLRLQEGNAAARDFTSYGHGTQRAVQMALVRHLAEVRRGAAPTLGTTLLLIDEPELYLHPFAVEQVRAALKSLGSTGYQVIFSTHSAQLVPSSDAQYALLMRKNDTRGTHARTRLRDAIQTVVPKSVHQMEQLFTLGNSSYVLFADRVLLTEGKTELRLLPAIYQSLRSRSLGQEGCALVAQSGVNDTKKSAEILASMDIPCKAIVDLDYAFNGAVRDQYLLAADPDLAALKSVLATLAAAGRISIGANGLPQGGVVTASDAFVVLAREAAALAPIASLHRKLLAQNIWLWQLGDIETHLGLTAKTEREWARFNTDLEARGLRAACPYPASVEQMLAWAVAREATQLIWTNFHDYTRLSALPASCAPTNRAEGYAVQAEVARLSGQPSVGWKIAATSAAGQKHINVDGPLAGRLLADRVFAAGSVGANAIDLRPNLLRVIEAEFTFRMNRALSRRSGEVATYSVDEVMSAVDSLHLSIEIPDTRFTDFVRVGAPSLIADLACASWWIVGDAVTADWRGIDLSTHRVTVRKGDAQVAEGIGSNVLGDPRIALTWLANELCTYGDGLKAGDYVTTGTCVVPVPCAPGDAFTADFGVLGTIAVAFPAA